MILPKKWTDVIVEDFIEVSKIDKTLGASHYNSEILSILSDEPIEVIEDLDIDDLNAYINEMLWANSEPLSMYKHKLFNYTIKPLSTLTLFEYIDLDHFFTNNYIANLDKICAILFRQTKTTEWGEVDVEPYDYDINIRAERFLDLPITDVYGIVKEFLKYRDKFLDNYRNLFQDGDDITEEEKKELSHEDKIEIEKEGKSIKWSWEYTIYNLTKGDITKSESVGKLPLTYVFNILAMKKELDI